MIIHRYTDFRAIFAEAGAPLDHDGFELFPVTLLRSSGFNGLVAPVITSYPFTLTVNGEASDGGFAYDWYLSQRTDDGPSQPLTIVQAAEDESGTVEIDLVDANVAALLPGVSGAGLVSAASLAIIFRNTALYVQRRSDKAYQWIALYPTPA